MLKANVGLSRKLSKDYNSTGFSLNLDGEINAILDDPETVIERIRELYNVAEEALQRQVVEHLGDSAIAAREAVPQPEPSPGRSNGYPSNGSGNGHSTPRNGYQNGKSGGGDPASNKQVQFLQTLAKREKLYGQKLEGLIEEITGRRCTPYDLTKGEAGQVIDHLNAEGSNDRNRR
jgi:hypothetical protein